MEILKRLKNIGLNNSEITVYLYLLEFGLSTPPQISKGTKIARTNCYNILRNLKDMGLVTSRMIRNRKAYLANNPNSLVRFIEQKKENVEIVLPDLRALYLEKKNKPSIYFYDGFDQIKEIFNQTLNSKEILAIASTNYLYSLDPVFFLKYQHKLKQKGIVFHDILTHESGKWGAKPAKVILKGFYDIKILPEKYHNNLVSIIIWNEFIAFITYKEPIFGTVIKNSMLADAFRLIFGVMWNGDKCTSYNKYNTD